MGNKKIDNLFQEQLKNLEVSPNKRVWNNIETQLKEKKRKVFPIWWFSAAAAVLLLITLFYPFSSDKNLDFNNNSNEIITTIPEEKPTNKTDIDSLLLKNKVNNETLISKKDDILDIEENTVSTARFIKQKETYQAKKRRSAVLLSYQPIDFDFIKSSQKTPFTIPKINDISKKAQKLNIAAVVKKEETQKTNRTARNWSVAPSFAVLKSNSLSDTSPINAGLAESTSGENSYSFGVQVAYQLNNKWSIRSGIHRQEMSYANKQVAVNRSSENNPFATKFSNGVALSFDNNTATNESAQLISNFVLTNVTSNSGSISQNYGYIEIPLEIKYNFSNNTKIDTQIVTGFSTLFLNKNEVILDTQNLSGALEAANLNNINFSGNLGFDFNYFLNKNWAFNLNPMFKLQLNTFSDNANGFAPFNVGIYTGIRYQF